MKKKFIKKLDGFNLYYAVDDCEVLHLYAYLNRKMATEQKYMIDKDLDGIALQYAYQHLIEIAKQNVSRT